ncbi:MAG: tetraacyldisaccharide 4'-kinase [Gammaproteobacteria bacterium]
MFLEQRIQNAWYGQHRWCALLAPLSWAYGSAASAKRYLYSALRPYTCAAPVVVVGNITVGGTGKTPLVIWLARCLRRRGYRPGIVTRGYGGRSNTWPRRVTPDSDPHQVGDESLLVARHCSSPVVAAGRRRAQAVGQLLNDDKCDVIVCDDGLQDYGLARDIEIAVVDGVRRFGNGRLLPAGPLREPIERLTRVDMLVARGVALANEFAMNYRASVARAVADDTAMQNVDELRGRRVHAVAGIGHPDSFFSLLRGFGIETVEHPFPDHYGYSRRDLAFSDGLPVIMTEKDAVKCRHFAPADVWYVPIQAELSSAFEQNFIALLENKINGQASS